MDHAALVSDSRLIDGGCTDGEITLNRRRDGVFVLTMLASRLNPENRWTLPFGRAVHLAFDAIEAELHADPKGAPAALLTVSASQKFFSNGIDPQWVMAQETPKEELAEWNDLTMSAFARPILLPIPTLCAIGGHAFGAGLMFALAHDYRLQQTDKGYLCAPEVAIGVNTPPPEFTLFRHSMPAGAFYETILHSKRWGASDALRAGIVQAVVAGKDLFKEATKTAGQHAQLGAKKACMGYTKAQVKGEVAREILTWSFPKGKQASTAVLPPGLLKHVKKVVEDGMLDNAWGATHVGAAHAPPPARTPTFSKL